MKEVQMRQSGKALTVSDQKTNLDENAVSGALNDGSKLPTPTKEFTEGGRAVIESDSNTIDYVLPKDTPQVVFFPNLAGRDHAVPGKDPYTNLWTVPTNEDQVNMITALGALGGLRRGEALLWRQIVKDDPSVLRRLKIHIINQLVMGIVPPVGEVGPNTDPKKLLRDSVNAYMENLVPVKDPADLGEVLQSIANKKYELRDRSEIIESVQLYHNREHLGRFFVDHGYRLEGNLTPEMSRELEKFGGKVKFRDSVGRLWDSPIERVVARRGNLPVEGEVREKLYSDLLRIARKSEGKDWGGPHGVTDDFKGRPVFYEQLDQSAGGFNAKPIFADKDDFLYYQSKETKKQIFLLSSEKRAAISSPLDFNEDEVRQSPLEASIQGYIDHINTELNDEVDIGEFALMKGMPAFSYECHIHIDGGQVFIQINGPRINLVVNGEFVGSICGVQLIGDGNDRLCRGLVKKLAVEGINSIEHLIEEGHGPISHTFGMDFNTVAMRLSDDPAQRERELKEFGGSTVPALGKNYVMRFMATELNNRWTALSHWRLALARYDSVNGTDLLKQVDNFQMVCVQTDHKALGTRVNDVTLGQGRASVDSTSELGPVKNSIRLLQLLSKEGVDILHGHSPFLRLFSGAKSGKTGGFRMNGQGGKHQGVMITNAPHSKEFGLLVVGPNVDYVRDQIEKIEKWADTSELVTQIDELLGVRR